jgi:hypothetical protein
MQISGAALEVDAYKICCKLRAFIKAIKRLFRLAARLAKELMFQIYKMKQQNSLN